MADTIFRGFSLDDVALKAFAVPLTVADGTTYDLSADIPADVMLDYFLLNKYPLAQRWQGAQDEVEAAGGDRHALAAALRAVSAEYQGEVRSLCGRIFRNSGYTLTDDALDHLFDAKAQEKIVRGFFSHLTAPSSTPPSSGDAPASATDPAETTPTNLTMPTSKKKATKRQ